VLIQQQQQQQHRCGTRSTDAARAIESDLAVVPLEVL